MKAFHAYDIRGIYNRDFDKNDVLRIGSFIPEVLRARRILVGRDCRISSPEIFSYLTRGLLQTGCDVYDAGLTTTPMIYWATAKYGFDASVMITASHNNKEYNGLKVSGRDAIPVGYDTGLKAIEQKIINGDPLISTTVKGKLAQFGIKSEYLEFQKRYKKDFSRLKIAVDCSNGMAGILIRELLGDETTYINEIPDGNFPGHDPNPLVPKNIKQLQNIVLKENCDIGVIFDGDADRVMFVDERANFIPPDLLIALMGHYFLPASKSGEKVLQDIRTSKATTRYVEKLGGQVHMWRVGRAYAAQKLREINGIYGGELAGHYYFRDFYFSDSGLMACLILLGLFKDFLEQGRKVSEVVASISSLANSGEINFRIEKKQQAMDALKNYFLEKEGPLAFYDFDGYRIEYNDWWFNIRPSNTEPYLRLIVEAANEQLLSDKLQIIKDIISKFS